MKTWKTLTMAFAAGSLLLVSGGALAQSKTKGPPKVIELEALVIEGTIAKPQVFYVLGRSRINYRGIKLQRSFVDRIVDSAKRNPF
jgi:hypothetical protein